MKVLIIYNCIPDETIVALVDVTKEQWKEIKLAHDYVVNADEFDEQKAKAVNIIGDTLLDPDKLQYACDGNEDWAGIFYNNILKGSEIPDILGAKKLIHCGIYL